MQDLVMGRKIPPFSGNPETLKFTSKPSKKSQTEKSLAEFSTYLAEMNLTRTF